MPCCCSLAASGGAPRPRSCPPARTERSAWLLARRYAFEALLLNQYGATNPRYLSSTVLQTFGLLGTSAWRRVAYNALSFPCYWVLAALAMTRSSYRKW